MAGQYYPSSWQKHRGKIAGIFTFFIFALTGALCIPIIGIPVAFAFSFIAAIAVVAAISIIAAIIVGKIISSCCEIKPEVNYTSLNSNSEEDEHASLNLNSSPSKYHFAGPVVARSIGTQFSTARSEDILAVGRTLKHLQKTAPPKPDPNRVMGDDERIPRGHLTNGWMDNHVQLFQAICHAQAKDINLAIRLHELHGISDGKTSPWQLLDRLTEFHRIKTIKDMKELLKKYHLHGLIDIYLSSSDSRLESFGEIYNETEKKLKDVLMKINEDIDDLKILRKAAKNHIPDDVGSDWRVILHRLIMEGTIKIGDEAVPSFYALLNERGLSKYIPPKPSAEAQTPTAEPAPEPVPAPAPASPQPTM